MAVQDRPTDPNLSDLTWAESNNKPAAEGSDLPSKPNDFIADGFGNRDVLPHASFNWLIRSMMRWIRWLVSKADNHVHDGLNQNASAPKVNATNLPNQINHLDWGTNGTLGTTINTTSEHQITHGGNATTKRIVTGQLHASSHVRTTTIQANGTGTTAPVNVRDSAGNHGLLNSAIVTATEHVQTNEIRRTSTGGTINVRDSNSSNTTLNVHNVSTSTLISNNLKNAGTFRAIRATTSSDTRGFLDARNVLRAAAHITNPSAATPTFSNRIGVEGGNLGFSIISRTATGSYRLTLAGPTSSNVAIFVTPISISSSIIATASIDGENRILVRTWSGSSLTDSSFYIAVYEFSSATNSIT